MISFFPHWVSYLFFALRNKIESMKAAVINKFGGVPQYQDFPDPTPSAGDIVIQVKAVVLENMVLREFRERLPSRSRNCLERDALSVPAGMTKDYVLL